MITNIVKLALLEKSSVWENFLQNLPIITHHPLIFVKTEPIMIQAFIMNVLYLLSCFFFFFDGGGIFSLAKPITNTQ